ncbi:hypothetical protein ANN_12970 [Periplaneta americana]|uniref:Uncharacterized protein n=1 Tax=Periplaneta americana TaxID=6978 RepID=A0ABQ8TI31_PERAM|nr:hypothetical protein ANN_12970 [Periplaneta americana]
MPTVQAPASRGNLLKWERKAFSTGCVKNEKRRGRPSARRETVPGVESLYRSPMKSTRKRAAELQVSPNNNERPLEERLGNEIFSLFNCPKAGLNLTSDTNKAPLMRASFYALRPRRLADGYSQCQSFWRVALSKKPVSEHLLPVQLRTAPSNTSREQSAHCIKGKTLALRVSGCVLEYTVHRLFLCEWDIRARSSQTKALATKNLLNLTQEKRQLTQLHHEERKEKRRGKLRQKVLFHQDNAPSHKSLLEMAGISTARCELLDHPPYSLVLVPSDFRQFPKIKNHLRWKKFSSNNEVMQFVNQCFAEVGQHFFQKAVEMFKHSWEKCIILLGDYVEK